jgi:hypothetical protein
MKNFLSRFLSRIPWTYVILLVVSCIIALVAKLFITASFGVLLFGTFFTIGLGFSLFIAFRQIYWFITKKGDYAKKN